MNPYLYHRYTEDIRKMDESILQRLTEDMNKIVSERESELNQYYYGEVGKVLKTLKCKLNTHILYPQDLKDKQGFKFAITKDNENWLRKVLSNDKGFRKYLTLTSLKKPESDNSNSFSYYAIYT